METKQPIDDPLSKEDESRPEDSLALVEQSHEVSSAPASDRAEEESEAAGAQALAEAEDRYLRLRAEFDNFRKRSAREREQALESGVLGLARPILSVLDNLERAIAHAGEDAGPWLNGIQMTLKHFHDVLEGAGIVPVDPAGEAFDPALHEAVSTEASESVPADRIIRVVTRGYRLGDRVVRPAAVVVSRGVDSQSDS